MPVNFTNANAANKPVSIGAFENEPFRALPIALTNAFAKPNKLQVTLLKSIADIKSPML